MASKPRRRSHSIQQKANAPLRGKIVLVTGASRGIGRAISRLLASEECRLVITGRDSSALNRISHDFSRRGIEVLAIAADLRDASSVKALCTAIQKKFHRLDVLVNNAGIGHPNLSVRELPPETWSDVIATNLTGMFLLTHFALPLMKAGSVIVNNLSIAAKRVFPGSSAYNASKHGALGFTNTLREELRPKGIRVIALLPGATDTDIWTTLWPEAPRAKMLSPQSIAKALLNALSQSTEGTVEELVIMPAAGTL